MARRPALALAVCTCALALSACGSGKPESYGMLVNDGLKALKQGNTAAATQKFKQAIARKKESPVAYYDLGVIYQHRGNVKQAEREYFLAIHYGPAYVPALYNQAGLLANRFRPLSVFYYERIIRVKPDSPTAYFNLGLIEAANPKSLKPALHDLAQAVKLDPALRAAVPSALRPSLPPAGKG